MLTGVMADFIKQYDYCSIILFDAGGNAFLSSPSHVYFDMGMADSDYLKCLATKEAVVSDINFDLITKGLIGHDIHLRIWIPVFASHAESETVTGVWLLQLDPDQYLFPLIQSWPTPSKSGETLLVRQEGNEIVFLNELRHKKNTALSFRLLVEKYMNTPAVKAVLGHEGVFEGIDYRGIPVLSVIKNIELNDWYIITKVDIDEIYAPLRSKGWVTGSILVVLILFSTWIIGMMIKRREDYEQLKVGAQWQTTFDSVKDVIWLLDAEFNIIRANQATSEIFGETAEAVRGKKCWSVVHNTSEAHESCPHKQMQLSKQRSSIELNNDDQWLFVSLDPILDGHENVIGVVHIIRDITVQKIAEQNIDALNESLERKVMERTTQLEASNKELEAFSYSVSHDLRAPLRAIDGWSLVLLEDYFAGLSAEARSILDKVRTETQRMGNLIDTLITLSKVTRVEMNIETINLGEIAQSVVRRLKEHEPERQIKCVIQADLYASADGNLMEIALTNLISNAFKFTAKTDKAEIEIGKVSLDNSHTFFIRDNGAGFDMTYINKLFGTFQRLHKSTEFQGTGIGLAMVKRIISRHGGKIWAESEPGQYTIFYFTLRED